MWQFRHRNLSINRLQWLFVFAKKSFDSCQSCSRTWNHNQRIWLRRLAGKCFHQSCIIKLSCADCAGCRACLFFPNFLCFEQSSALFMPPELESHKVPEVIIFWVSRTKWRHPRLHMQDIIVLWLQFSWHYCVICAVRTSCCLYH